MLVLIPAYEPGDSLIALVRELRAHSAAPNVLVVDDGSGPDHDEIFALARIHGATAHRYQENRGKGHALKTGFAIARRYHPGEVVVCADSDGQHKVPDIMLLLNALITKGFDAGLLINGLASQRLREQSDQLVVQDPDRDQGGRHPDRVARLSTEHA